MASLELMIEAEFLANDEMYLRGLDFVNKRLHLHVRRIFEKKPSFSSCHFVLRREDTTL